MREAELMAHDHWTRDELLAYQQGLVRTLIRHAVTRSPYYREVLGVGAPERPLAELPTLPKTTLMAEFDRIVTDQRLRLADLRGAPRRPRPLAVLSRCVSGSNDLRYHWPTVDHCIHER
jgi:hypothetical protein